MGQSTDSKFSLRSGFWRETGGRWPDMITIISHEFKRQRFLDLHIVAMRWPRQRVLFVGIDPVYMIETSKEWDEARTKEVRSGERYVRSPPAHTIRASHRFWWIPYTKYELILRLVPGIEATRRGKWIYWGRG